MKICVLPVEPTAESDRCAALRATAELDRGKRYTVVAKPGDAEITLMPEFAVWGDCWWRLETFNRHPMVRAGSPNLFIYHEEDQPWCPYQGLYCCMPASGFNRFRQRAVPYFRQHNPYVLEERNRGETVPPEHLFSFVGWNNHPVRDRILQLNHARAHIADSSSFNIYAPGSDIRGKDDRMKSFVEVTRKSKFVLCPRGMGTSSFRLFEALALGRVPVIISDQWVEPAGPRWREFSLRVSERDLDRLPGIVESAEARWPAMAEAASRAFMEWFAPDILFHRMVEACFDIRRRNVLPERLWRCLPDRQLVRYRVAGKIRDWRNGVRRKGVLSHSDILERTDHARPNT